MCLCDIKKARNINIVNWFDEVLTRNPNFNFRANFIYYVYVMLTGKKVDFNIQTNFAICVVFVMIRGIPDFNI